MSDLRIKITPAGALAGAFAKLVEDADDGKAWWRRSPPIAAVGLAYHLDEMGWTLIRKTDDTPPESWTEDTEGYIVAPLENRGTLDAG